LAKKKLLIGQKTPVQVRKICLNKRKILLLRSKAQNQGRCCLVLQKQIVARRKTQVSAAENRLSAEALTFEKFIE